MEEIRRRLNIWRKGGSQLKRFLRMEGRVTRVLKKLRGGGI